MLRRRFQPLTRKQAAFSFVELLLVMALIGALTAMAMPRIRDQLDTSKGRQCSANLLMIESAKDSFIADHPGIEIASTSDLLPYLKYGMPTCPSGGTYSNVTDRFNRVTCSSASGTASTLHTCGQP